MTVTLPSRSPSGPYTSCSTPYATAKDAITADASPVVTWKSPANATSIGSHTRMEAMLQKAARLIKRSRVVEEVMGEDCGGKHTHRLARQRLVRRRKRCLTDGRFCRAP